MVPYGAAVAYIAGVACIVNDCYYTETTSSKNVVVFGFCSLILRLFFFCVCEGLNIGLVAGFTMVCFILLVLLSPVWCNATPDQIKF